MSGLSIKKASMFFKKSCTIKEKKISKSKEIKEYSLIGKTRSFKLQIFSSSLSALAFYFLSLKNKKVL